MLTTALLCSGSNKEEVMATVESEAAKVYQWAFDNHLTLKTVKSEIAFSSMDASESSWNPKITVGGSRFKTNHTPTLLEVRYDRRLTFNDQVRHLNRVMKQRSSLMRQLSGKSWDPQDLPRPLEMRTIYIATLRSLAEYAAPACALWASKTTCKSLLMDLPSTVRRMEEPEWSSLEETHWHVPNGTFSSSFQAEKSSLIAALFWLKQKDDWFSVSITDCKSLLQALSSPNITDQTPLFLNTSIAAFY